MRSTGNNLGRIFNDPDYELVPTSGLEEEFDQGRIPIFLWQQILMSPSERERFSEDMWITTKLCHEPLGWSLHYREIGGLNKISFDIGVSSDKDTVLNMFNPHLRDISSVLQNLMIVCGSTRIKRSELDTMAESLFILRLAGDEQQYPFSKLCLFDQGIIHLKPQDIISCTKLRQLIRKKRKRIYDRLIEVSVSILNRFLSHIDDHPQFLQYKQQVLLWHQNRRYQNP